MHVLVLIFVRVIHSNQPVMYIQESKQQFLYIEIFYSNIYIYFRHFIKTPDPEIVRPSLMDYHSFFLCLVMQIREILKTLLASENSRTISTALVKVIQFLRYDQ